MSLYTLEEAIEFRDAAKAAYLAALPSQEYSMGTRRLVRPDIVALKANLDSWSKVVATLQGRVGIRIWGGTPL